MSEPNPLELLKEEMESDQVYLRVNAIHRLQIVSTIIGPDGIKTQLLPYIDSLIKKEEDEVLFAIAQELETLAPCLPGSQTDLLPYLQALASQQETVVRDMAVKSLISVSNNLGDYQIVNYYIPMIIRLASNDTNFTCRVSAVNLICPIYQRAGQHKEKLRQKFSELCGEETPMVRRAVAIKIGNLATVVEKEHVLNEFILNIKQLIQDDQDQVRVLALDSLKQVAQILSQEENKTHTLPIIIGATEDKSWRVRLELSKIFADLAQAFGQQVADVSLIQIFTNLLRDAENDVRIAAIHSLAKFVRIVSPEKLQIIVPHLQYLARDSVHQVRSGVTEVISTMASLLPKDLATQKLLLHIQEMFADENKEVRTGACRAAAQFVEAVGPDSINTLIPYFQKAIEDDKWRVRLQAYESLVELAQHYHNPEMFTKHIEPLYMNFLQDRVSAVREGGVEKLGVLILTIKSDWFITRMLPQLVEHTTKDNTYLTRMSALQGLKAIALNTANEVIEDKILPHLFKNITDPVPNIRFCVVQILKEVSTKFQGDATTLEKIKQQIEPLVQDTDKDVKYYAQEYLGLAN